MKRVGFFLTPTKGWMGGINYFKNLFHAVGAAAGPQVEICLVVPANVDEEALRMMLPPAPSNVKVTRAKLLQKGHPLWFAWRVVRKLFGSDLGARPLVKKLRLDVVSHSDFVRGAGVPVLNWLPDFQHVHLPQMFGADEIAARTAKYVDLSRHADRVIVSSEDAARDLADTLPNAAAKARVLSFVSSTPPRYWQLDEGDCERVRTLYQLDRQFFYVPNQFWQHKNHAILLEALKVAKERKLRLQIVCSGATVDHRNPAHFETLQRRAAEIGAGDAFKVLGVIPYEDVFTLIRFSCAVVNPSRFEGWSSTVEECKSAGKRMLLSDIPVHREQMPQAAFFDPGNAVELADLLVQTLATAESAGPDTATAAARNQQRQQDYGRRFVEIVDDAIRRTH
jgi:glycosyltransferase involved in cell wall biosynthesis